MGGSGDSGHPLVGYVLLAAGMLDAFLAVYFGLLRPPPDPRARKILSIAFAASALVLFGLGAAFLLGVFAQEG